MVKRRLDGSFTVEAALVLSVVFLALGAVIQQAYRLHDRVTGTMILEEALEIARYHREEETADEFFERRGEQLGNPRLWLGTYRLWLERGEWRTGGRAAAGDWFQEMDMSTFRPGETLRRYQALQEMGKKWIEDED